MPRSHHLLLIVVLVVVGLWVHRAEMFQPGPLVDEEFYEAGFQALATTGSAYDAEGFMYPPTFAAAGLWLQDNFGVVRVRLSVRWLNFGCLIGLFWGTIYGFLRVRDQGPLTPWGLALAGLLLMISPGARLGLYVGNISFLIGCLVLLGFWWADRRPITAGVLLATSLLMKPLAAGSLPLLLLRNKAPARPTRGSDTSHFMVRRWIVAGIAGVLSLSILWFFRDQLPAMLQTEMTSMAQNRSMSLFRISRLLGLGEQRLIIFSILTAALCGGLWERLGSPRSLLVGALSAIPLTTLAVWSHTLILFFPVAALVLARMLHRRYPPVGRDSSDGWGRRFRLPSEPKERLEVVGVLGAIALIYFVHSGGFPQLPAFAQIALLLPPTLAPVSLLIYWFATEESASHSIQKT